MFILQKKFNKTKIMVVPKADRQLNGPDQKNLRTGLIWVPNSRTGK